MLFQHELSYGDAMRFYKSSTTESGYAGGKEIPFLGKALITLSLLCGSAAQAGTLCYVNGTATGKNDGTSWTDAYTNPQFALLKDCPEIWVAKGVYKPTVGTDRTVTFTVDPGVSLYGGFAGNETTRDERLPADNVTVLSGDIDSNDAHAGAGDIDTIYSDIRGSNSYHVVDFNGETGPLRGSTVLDGFTITGGNADDVSSPEHVVGGGLYCVGQGGGDECSPTLRALIISGNNAANYGGGLFADAFSKGTSNPTLINVTFVGNHAGVAGGAMYNNGDGGLSSPSLQNVFFNANSAPSGGAMFSFADSLTDAGMSSPVLSSVMFVGNTANVGGAIYLVARNGGQAAPVLNIVTFSKNTTPATGPTFVGGAIYSEAQGAGSIVIPTFFNVTFSENGSDVGGAIANIGDDSGRNSPRFFNVTFDGNTAVKGGAVYNMADHGAADMLMVNVILWGDGTSGGVDPEVSNDGATARLDHTVIQGGCPADATFTCSSIFVGDPILGPLAENGGFTRTLLPGLGSSAIDTGDDTDCPAIDQRGLTRPQGPHCEIGAVEVVPLPPPVAQPESIIDSGEYNGHILLAASDVNPGGPFTFHAVTSVTHGLLFVAGASVTYIPTTNYVGPDSFTYTATDTNGTSAPATVSIQVIRRSASCRPEKHFGSAQHVEGRNSYRK